MVGSGSRVDRILRRVIALSQRGGRILANRRRESPGLRLYPATGLAPSTDTGLSSMTHVLHPAYSGLSGRMVGTSN